MVDDSSRLHWRDLSSTTEQLDTSRLSRGRRRRRRLIAAAVAAVLAVTGAAIFLTVTGDDRSGHMIP
ncbi:MAG: hypothetical protein F2789_16745 [Actinobacteria bacterium]|nr:hypothetical protein [Actinomycetota bacterium]